MHDNTTISYFRRRITSGPRPERLDEQEQVARASNGDRDAIGLLMSSNFPGVVHIAKEFRGRGVPFDDLIAEGCVGLLKSIRHYRAVNGTRFMTYASFWIRKEILAAVADQPHAVHVPRYARQHGHVGVRVQSLDAPNYEPGDIRIADRLRHPDRSPSEATIDSEQELQVQRHVLELAPRDQAVIVWRYGLDGEPSQTLNAVARRLALSKERVRQIEVSALARLRDAFVERFPPRARCQNAIRFRRAPGAPTVPEVGSK